MVTKKQIRANRKNAQKSTGPKTKMGRWRSSRNAYRHGLSLPLPDDEPTMGFRTRLAEALGLQPQAPDYEDFSDGHLEILRLRHARARAISSLLQAIASDQTVTDPKAILRMERYERLASQKRRRGIRLLKQLRDLS